MTGWKKLGLEIAGQPEVVQQSKSYQSSQPNPNPDHDRTVQPVVYREENHEQPTVVCSEQTTHPRFSRDGTNFNVEDEAKHDRTGKPVVCCQSERSMVNEIDFRIPGLPHSVVKQAENYRVRELVKKIENHLIEKIFNEIYNKHILTTRSVRSQNRWSRTWGT